MNEDNAKIKIYYDELRSELMSVPYYKEHAQELLKNGGK